MIEGYDNLEKRIDELEPYERFRIISDARSVLEVVEQLDEETFYTRELEEKTSRNKTEIGRTLAALEELYNIDMRPNEIQSNESRAERSERALWSKEPLEENEDIEELKEYLEPSF